jgi:hypothetical protein
MIRFMCDSCGRAQKTGQEWILGLAAESVGAQSVSRPSYGCSLLLRPLQGKVHAEAVRLRSCVKASPRGPFSAPEGLSLPRLTLNGEALKLCSETH